MKTVFFALQERSTGRLLPVSKFGTRAEFDDSGPPRLFLNRSAATQSLNYWRLGMRGRPGDEDAYSPVPPDSTELLRPTKSPGLLVQMIGRWNTNTVARRKATLVDVVDVLVTIRSPHLPFAAFPTKIANMSEQVHPTFAAKQDKRA